MNQLLPHQERVVQEQVELHQKMMKLRTFMQGDVFRALDALEHARLDTQLYFMEKYHQILVERIEAWK